MSVEVVMPQMGESITEGTVSKWLKAVGDAVEKDESLLEISTDKVDAEVPAPSAGILLEIRAAEGETVEVNSVVGVLGAEGEQAAGSNGNSQTAAAPQIGQPESETQPVVEEAKQTETAEQSQTAAAATSGANSQSANSIPQSSEDAAEIVMPQMGESITEGTVSKWLKSVGDAVEKDEPLLEISTDKVDAEVPSPTAGILLEIRANEGETVEVGAVVGVVGAQGASAVRSPQSKVRDKPLPQLPKRQARIFLPHRCSRKSKIEPPLRCRSKKSGKFRKSKAEATIIIVPMPLPTRNRLNQTDNLQTARKPRTAINRSKIYAKQNPARSFATSRANTESTSRGSPVRE